MLNKSFFRTFLGFTAMIVAAILLFLAIAGWNFDDTQESTEIESAVYSE